MAMATVEQPSLWLLLRVWFMLGLQSFGGGMATLYLIQRTTVERYHWLTAAEFSRDWALCQAAPGINLLGMTILIGRKVAGLAGALVALVPWLWLALRERHHRGPAHSVATSSIWSVARSPKAVALAIFFGTQSMQAYVGFGWIPQILVDNGLCDDPSDLYHTLLVKAIKTERWRKWMTGDDVNLQVDDILADDELSLKILDVSGHYAFNDPEVKEQVEKLYRNLAAQDIDGKRFVIEHIKRPIKQYVVGLNLKGVTSRIEKALED